MKVAREAHVAAFETRSTRSEETERHVIQPTKSEKQVDQVSHTVVLDHPMRTEREIKSGRRRTQPADREEKQNRVTCEAKSRTRQQEKLSA